MPDSPIGREFVKAVSVRFALADHARILFFANAFILAHEVLEDFILHVGFAWDDYFARDDWGMPYRYADADYFKPLEPGVTAEARLAIERIGQSSVAFRVHFHDEAGDEACCVRMVAAAVSLPGMKKRGVPDVLRERLQPYMVGH